MLSSSSTRLALLGRLRASSASSLLNNNCRWLSTSDSQEQGIYNRVAFIGAGKMSQAMLEPLIKTGLQPASQISVYDVSNSAMEQLRGRFEGLHTVDSLADLADLNADLMVCAVKPQNLDAEFFAQVVPRNNPDKTTTLLSVVAGKPMSAFLQGGFTKVARSMPNTPAQIGRGMTVWTATKNIGNDERTKIKKILSSFGKSIFVDDENFIDMSTSISGSGPAYIFMLMEAMIDAGVHMGFSRDTAQTLVYHTLLGSTLYAMESGEHPAILRNRVTSPAGTTASALYELENGKFRTVIKDAIWACYRRSLEMGGHDSNVGPGRYTDTSVTPEAATLPKGHHFREAPKGEMVADRMSDSDDDDEQEGKKAESN